MVHDDTFRPARSNNLPPRWDSLQEPSGWEASSTGYHFSPTAEPGQVDWLSFRNWRCFVSPFVRSQETPVRDHYGYNQNTSRGKLHNVTDLMLSCRVRWSGASKLWLSVRNGRDSFQVELDRRHSTATIRRQDIVIGKRDCPLLTDFCQLEFGICDRQLFLTVNRRVAFRLPFDPSEQPLEPTASPLALGGDGAELEIGELQVFRDIYYLDPNGWCQECRLQVQSEGGEILVLGDNVPISRDSRHWESAGLAHKSLIGRVLTPF